MAYTTSGKASTRRLWDSQAQPAWQWDTGKGRYGYETEDTWLSAKRWRGPGKPDHFELSGTACRDLEAAAGSELGAQWSWQGHLNWLLRDGCRISRLDFAIDLVGCDVAVEDVVDAIRRGLVKTRWDPQKGRVMTGLMPGPYQGATLYLGSPGSDTLMRCYDKRAEQRMPVGSPTWVRWEWQLRRAPAQALAQRIADGGAAAGVRAFCGHFDWLDETGHRDPRWAAAVGSVDALALHVPKRGGTVDAAAEWVRRGVAPSLAMLAELADDPDEYLAEILRLGREHWNAKHRSAVEEGLTNP